MITCNTTFFKASIPEEHYFFNKHPDFYKSLLGNPSHNIQEAFDAYNHALIFGKSDQLRSTAASNPLIALQYARNVDKKPHDITRKGAALHPRTSFEYALLVDKKPHQDTKLGAQKHPHTKLRYLLDIEKHVLHPALIAKLERDNYNEWLNHKTL